MKNILKYFIILALFLEPSCIRERIDEPDDLLCPCGDNEHIVEMQLSLPYTAPKGRIITHAIGDKEENTI